MAKKNLLNELENGLIYGIAVALMAGLVYYILDYGPNKEEGYWTHVSFYFLRLFIFIIPGTVAALIKFIKRKEWDFRLFFWFNLGVNIIVLVVSINLRIFS